MKTVNKITSFVGFLYLAIAIAALIGWGLSVYKFATCNFDPIGKSEIIYGIGTFAPPSAIVIGYLDIEDE